MEETRTEISRVDESPVVLDSTLPDTGLQEHNGVGDGIEAGSINPASVTEQEIPDIDYARFFRYYLANFSEDITSYQSKPIAKSIYEPVFNIFHGVTFHDAAQNSAATQGFALGILLSFLMRDDFTGKASLAKDISYHYAASFWDALATTRNDMDGVTPAVEEAPPAEEISNSEGEGSDAQGTTESGSDADA